MVGLGGVLLLEKVSLVRDGRGGLDGYDERVHASIRSQVC